MPSNNNESTALRGGGGFWATFVIFLSTSVIYTCAARGSRFHSSTGGTTTTGTGAAFISTTTTTTTTTTDTDTRTTTSGSNHKNKISSSTSISLQQQQQTNANAKNGNDSNNTNGGDGTPGMPILPKGVVKYSQVPKEGKQFTGTTIPSGLLKTHTTKKGTWGVIRVSQGLLEYSIPIPNPKAKAKSKSKSKAKAKAKATDDDDDDDDQDQKYAFELSKDFHGIIEPLRLHQVRPLTPDVEFVVEFMRLPNTGPVDEKREGL